MWTYFLCASTLSFSFSIFAGSFTKASQACSPPGNTLPAQSPQKSKLMTSTWSPPKKWIFEQGTRPTQKHPKNKGFMATKCQSGPKINGTPRFCSNQVIERSEPKPSSGDSLLPNDWWICYVLRNVYVVFVFRDDKTVFIFHTMQSAPILAMNDTCNFIASAESSWKYTNIRMHDHLISFARNMFQTKGRL